MSSRLKAELAATCSTLGRFHRGEYMIEPECLESVKDLIRFLKRDDEAHEIRRYLGEAKVLQNDLIHIVKSCPDDSPELFDVVLRLLINLTTPTMLIYGEEMPAEKIGRNIYLSLIGYEQDYKTAFGDVEFWNKICGKLTNLFETDWSERSADDGIQIERILMLLRNVLQVPADDESLKKPDNDVTTHDKVLWALRQSQILELLLFVSSNENEDQYYLNLLEIFSLILREQNPKVLAQCDLKRSVAEKNVDAEELFKAREMEKRNQNKYTNARTFTPTFVMKGVKTLANNDIVCHKPLEKVTEVVINNPIKKRGRARRNKISAETERLERRSVFSIRLFLKEFALEFLNSGFTRMMSVVKNRLDSGKSLVHDESYYFWALRFFLEFAVATDSDVSLVQRVLTSESFHFVQTSMDNAFEHLQADKKKSVDWVKRIHLILKAYRSLLETLLWMDNSKNPMTRALSREIKSEIFNVVEYREMTLHLLLRYELTKFSTSYLRDLIETTHLFIKLLEEFSKQTKLVVQKVTRKKSKKTKKKDIVVEVETNEQKWDKIKDDVYDMLSCESAFPEIPPFDAASDVPIDDQKGIAMKRIQNLLHKANIKEAIGLLRSARQVWPENEYFGSETMSVEDETMALQEICLADLGEIEDDKENENPEPELQEEEDEEDEEEEDRVQVVEKDFDMLDFKKRLVNKKIVEGCGILLANYKKNSDHTNHCVVKLLHRIGWECCMPAMLYQASLFWTLLKIKKDKSRNYNEINTFTVNLVRKFRKHAMKNPVVFLELLFWKENNVALEIQHGYEPYEDKPKQRRGRKKKSKGVNEEDMLEENNTGKEKKKRKRRNRKKQDLSDREHDSDESVSRNEEFETEPNTREDFSLEISQNSRRSSISDDEEGLNGNEKELEKEENRKEMEEEENEKESEEESEKELEENEKEPEDKENESTGITQSQNTLEDQDSNSQHSDISYKKRTRQETLDSDTSPGKESIGSDISKSKRPRYIGSDSDAENYQSDEEVVVTTKNRRRLAVVDSDSDD